MAPHRGRLHLTVLGFILWAAASAAHADLVGRVVKVVDGDTLDVLVDEKPVRVRLAEIDAPERGQPFGSKSREALASAVASKLVQVIETDRDRYGRVVGIVMLDGRNINAQQIDAGMAWAYERYVRDVSLFERQAAAKESKRGLWFDADPVPPWEWRASRRKN